MRIEQRCGICYVQKILHRDIEFCVLCDNPPKDDAIWFVLWQWQEPQ